MYYRYIFKSAGKRIYIKYPIWVKGPEYISVGSHFSCGCRTRIEAWDCHGEFSFKPYIKIGEGVTIGNDCHLGAINKIIIGDNVLTGARVLITDHSHGMNSKNELKEPVNERKLYSKGEVIIGNNVWIGEGASILPNVRIGDNVVIGCNSVVTHNMPADSLVAGNPARVIKMMDEI